MLGNKYDDAERNMFDKYMKKAKDHLITMCI